MSADLFDGPAEDTLPALQPIGVFGELIDSFVAVRSTRGNPVILLGSTEDKTILAPFIEMVLLQNTEDGEGETPLFTAILPFENMPHVINSLLDDFERNCKALRMASSGELGPPADRVEYSIANLIQCQATLKSCLEHLTAMRAPPVSAPTKRKPLRKLRRS